MNEFLKRMNRGFPVEDRNVVIVKQGGEVEWIKKYKVLEIVESAKKEYVDLSNKWNKEHQGSYDMDGLVQIFEEWFERWFMNSVDEAKVAKK